MAKRVIVTRPAEQAAAWTDALQAAGLNVLSLPLIAIGAPPDPQAVEQAWERIATFDSVMFVSANAARYFFRLKPMHVPVQDGGAPFHARALATGPGTVAALRDCGVPADAIVAPDAHSGQFDSEALWQVIRARVRPGHRILIVRGAQDAADDSQADADPASTGAGRDWFAQQAGAVGARVDFVVAYRRQAPVLQGQEALVLQSAAQDASVWLFSSSEAVVNLQVICPGRNWSQARAVATHPRIAQAAREAGFGTVLVSRPALGELVASIESLP